MKYQGWAGRSFFQQGGAGHYHHMAAINITEQAAAAAAGFEVIHNLAPSTYTITLPSTTTPPTQHYYVCMYSMVRTIHKLSGQSKNFPDIYKLSGQYINCPDNIETVRTIHKLSGQSRNSPDNPKTVRTI